MPVIWTSPGNFSTARPGSGRADRPDAIPFRQPRKPRPAKSATSVQLRISLIKVGSVPARA